jgi:MinD-like ATPase involved in chromosome partitioning or flagellar assembly
MSARVVTFYSYKGGVGRSFALANVAVILAQWGARVLAVDWDTEAPGLVHYFAGSQPPRGVLDFLDDCQRDEVGGYGVYKAPYALPSGDGVVDLLHPQIVHHLAR